MKLSIPIHQLKRQAKSLQRQEGLARHEALDRVAGGQGFRGWSHLASASPGPDAAAEVYADLRAGEILLIGARPGQGKTLLALALAREAMKAGRRAAFFTLEYTREETLARLASVGADPGLAARAFIYDGSDEICADHIIRALASSGPAPFAVVDYLQLLDQKRTNPPLAEQIAALVQFARRTGATIACISQIDRRFAQSSRSLPSVADLRLPNPVDLTAFDRMCFLHEGRIEMFAHQPGG